MDSPAGNRARSQSCRWLAACATFFAFAAGAAPDMMLSRFDALVDAVAVADAPTRLAFADIALGALIEANETELQAGGRAWQRGARDYVERLRATRALLRARPRVDVIRAQPGAVRLLIDTRQVMLTAPREGRQAMFEARIADAVCADIGCALSAEPASVAHGAVSAEAPASPASTSSGIVAVPTVDDVVATRERRLTGEWSLSDRGPPMFSQDDGLHCAFADTRHLRLKQAACEAVTRELRLLEEALRAVLQRRGQVDWQALAVRSVGGSQDARVSYGANGRYFELGIPTLAAAPEVVLGAVPWLQTRLRGQRAEYVITAPERLAYRVPDTE